MSKCFIVLLAFFSVCLSYTGQEALWRRTFMQLGLNDTVLGQYFGGPAFLAWARGQQIQGVGGPLPSWWYDQQLRLGQHVVTAMVDMGIVPVLPVFEGNVPPALHYLFPSANISKDGAHAQRCEVIRTSLMSMVNFSFFLSFFLLSFFLFLLFLLFSPMPRA